MISPLGIGRELTVGAILIGRISKRGEELSISIELVDAHNGWRLWGEQYTRKPSDMLQFQEQISRAASEKLRPGLSRTEQ